MQPLGFDNARQLGAVVRTVRERSGLTQVELARKASVERQWLVLFENGKVDNPTLGNILAVTTALNLRLQAVEESAQDVTIDDLFG